MKKILQYTKTICLIGLLFFSLNIYSQSNKEANSPFIQNIDSRERTSLNGLWQIIIDPLENGYYNHRLLPREKSGFFANRKMESPSDLIEYDFDTDYQLNVPGDWNTQMEKLYYYEGTVWYKKTFDYIQKLEKEQVYLYFEAVNYDAKIYLNGKMIGSHIGGYTPFQIDVSGKLLKEDNHLVVKVDNKRKREAIPTVNTDWWNYGGITRSVHLIHVPKQHILDYTIGLKKGSKNEINGHIETKNGVNGEKATITIPELGINKEVVIKNNSTNFTIKANPELWHPKHPKLYDVKICFKSDTITDKIGFRTIATQGSKIILNGEAIFLKGISIHEEAPFKTGRVATKEECITLLKWAKDLGCNFIRLAHYPHSESMVKEAEKMGFLIWSEIPVYWTVLFDNPVTYDNAEQQLFEMISRDKNRAAIILWSIANETPEGNDRLDFLSKLSKKTRQLDDSRLITAALDTQTGSKNEKIIEDKLGNYVDVIGINSYCGWYSGAPESCNTLRWKNHFNKPMIMSELGGGALQGLHGEPNQRWTEEYQEAVYINNIEMLRNIDFLSGVSPWILMDFRSPRRHLRRVQKDFNRKGLISEQGIPKKAFYTLQEYYKNENN
ncbi:glycoside hydrolase family 2 TIM barrel-domain containing protein [Flavivirga amylovorans]|uniref:Beta-glucuronidase n=1 Tax=Flavivirga amylovorans TaxID=870486 RepID=A0ABT8WZG8_9FLAO|nr:glycoside hydrolase family 2 TIM barrel-domain containing protein [Flavivirga amylovorans]MDO5987079.1 glycoside hydrolase family 2 TIM barrel-domain containing protein [Flavivirga amylovorans]